MQWNEEQLDRAIGVVLRVGVIAAAAVVLGGGAWYLARFGTEVPNYRAFHGEPQGLRSVAGIWKGVVAIDPRSVIQLGLLLLIATPIARVALSVFAFAARRDRTYVAITLVVLAVLIGSLTGLVSPPR
jgi:uncharacterized membrane protein